MRCLNNLRCAFACPEVVASCLMMNDDGILPGGGLGADGTQLFLIHGSESGLFALHG